MKKIVLIGLVIVFMLSMIGCQDNKDKDQYEQEHSDVTDGSWNESDSETDESEDQEAPANYMTSDYDEFLAYLKAKKDNNGNAGLNSVNDTSSMLVPVLTTDKFAFFKAAYEYGAYWYYYQPTEDPKAYFTTDEGIMVEIQYGVDFDAIVNNANNDYVYKSDTAGYSEKRNVWVIDYEQSVISISFPKSILIEDNIEEVLSRYFTFQNIFSDTNEIM